MERPEVVISDLAHAADCTPAALRYWRSGKRTPGVVQAVKLQRATDNAVPVESWAMEVLG
jgi:hypothetical protein